MARAHICSGGISGHLERDGIERTILDGGVGGPRGTERFNLMLVCNNDKLLRNGGQKNYEENTLP